MGNLYQEELEYFTEYGKVDCFPLNLVLGAADSVAEQRGKTSRLDVCMELLSDLFDNGVVPVEFTDVDDPFCLPWGLPKGEAMQRLRKEIGSLTDDLDSFDICWLSVTTTSLSEPPSAHEFENDVVLDAVQALLGLITPNVRAVGIRVARDRERVTFVFWVGEHTTELDEDIEELIVDMAAINGGNTYAMDTDIRIGYPDFSGGDRGVRFVYAAKRP
ncbi:hypothetical protein GCM10027440_08450 [Nocardiopsis coralliicola]